MHRGNIPLYSPRTLPTRLGNGVNNTILGTLELETEEKFPLVLKFVLGLILKPALAT